MASFPYRISIDAFVPSASLFGDFLRAPDGVAGRALGGFAAHAPAWAARVGGGRLAPGRSAARGRLFDRMAEYNRTLGVASAVTDRIAGIADGSTRVVVTGQQPGVLGGPLMTLHKIETARALAARVESAHGVACIPVYWMGADDADFAEIRELVVLDRALHALATALPTGAHEVAMPVGDIAVAWLESLWDGLDAFVAGFEGSAEVSDAVARSLRDGEDHAGVTARLVAALTRGDVAVVDGREPLLRDAARRVILGYFDREDEVRSAVAASGRSLEGAGFHAQLSTGPDSGVFLLENGRRGKITTERRDEARRRLEARVADASPGVVLRNLVQDIVFDPVAAVLGPAEIAYRAQIRGVYDLFEIEPPVCFPRLFATYVPPAIAALVSDTLADPERLVADPAEFVRGVYESQADRELDAARARLDAAMAAAVDTFLAAAAAAVDPAGLEKMRKRLADVRRRLEQATASIAEVGRARSLERWPFLEGIPDAFARRGVPQERYLSMLTPFLFGGLDALGVVRDAASAHVDAAMDGRVDHIVYSG